MIDPLDGSPDTYTGTEWVDAKEFAMFSLVNGSRGFAVMLEFIQQTSIYLTLETMEYFYKTGAMYIFASHNNDEKNIQVRLSVSTAYVTIVIKDFSAPRRIDVPPDTYNLTTDNVETLHKDIEDIVNMVSGDFEW